jgi:hypothetical protein
MMFLALTINVSLIAGLELLLKRLRKLLSSSASCAFAETTTSLDWSRLSSASNVAGANMREIVSIETDKLFINVF